MKIARTSAFLALLFLCACSHKPSLRHSQVQYSGCNPAFSRSDLVRGMMKEGYLRLSNTAQYADIFRKTKLEKGSKFSADPYADRSEQFAVVACSADTALLVEVMRRCEPVSVETPNDLKCVDSSNEKEYDAHIAKIEQALKKQGCTVRTNTFTSRAWEAYMPQKEEGMTPEQQQEKVCKDYSREAPKT